MGNTPLDQGRHIGPQGLGSDGDESAMRSRVGSEDMRVPRGLGSKWSEGSTTACVEFPILYRSIGRLCLFYGYLSRTMSLGCSNNHV
jgi:hypothetical protein